MIRILPATSDAELAEVERIVNAVRPDEPVTVADMRWADEKYPGGRRFLAWLGGEAVGVGGGGRVYMFPPDYPAWWGNLTVLPEHRRRGVGGALLAAVSDAARSAGKTELMGRTTADRPEAIEFLERRGFREHERMKVVRLELGGLPPVAIEAPAGIVITSLAERPDLVEGVYAVAKQVLPDIPGEGPVAPDTLEEFRTRGRPAADPAGRLRHRARCGDGDGRRVCQPDAAVGRGADRLARDDRRPAAVAGARRGGRPQAGNDLLGTGQRARGPRKRERRRQCADAGGESAAGLCAASGRDRLPGSAVVAARRHGGRACGGWVSGANAPGAHG